jgi:hypothetical protein
VRHSRREDELAERENGAIPEGLRRLVEGESDLDTLMAVAKFLKATRNHILLAWFTEQILRRMPTLEFWHLHAQALIELGLLAAADELLDGIREQMTGEADRRVAVDLWALEGRIAKQRLVEARPDDPRRQEFLATAIAHYRHAELVAGDDPRLRYFPGVNLIALYALGGRLGLALPEGSDALAQARKVSIDLNAVAAHESGLHWWQATLAECSLALGDSPAFVEAVSSLVNTKKSPEQIDREKNSPARATVERYFDRLPDIDPYNADAFVLASFHRQLVEIWQVDRTKDEIALAAVMGLRQALLKRRGGSLELDQGTIQSMQRLNYTEEAVLGEAGPMPFRWVLQGIERASSVGAVLSLHYGEWRRIGTGFLVDVEGLPEQRAFLTNQHVVRALPREGIRIRFEALGPPVEVWAEEIVWQSPVEEHDVTLLTLSEPVAATPLARAESLPELIDIGPEVRVYVIGHTLGQELTISLQDNELLDHEGDPSGADPKRLRLHYRAPTQVGNSGSPVFAENGWEPIALHHRAIDAGAGLDTTLTGRRRYQRANEGISLASIGNAMLRDTGLVIRQIGGAGPDRKK